MRDYLVQVLNLTIYQYHLGNLKKQRLSRPHPKQIQSESLGLESGISGFRSFPGNSKVSSERTTDITTPHFSEEKPKLQGN